jgi:predicted DCC family thiol-disulfide oxidoreductase YuxK
MGGIVLFDGVCNFCNATINFIIEHDPDGYFKFAPLQSEAGRALAEQYGVAPAGLRGSDDPNAVDSVILIEGGKAYTHSAAALRIAGGLTGGWSWLSVLRVVPRPIRDAAYRSFARKRYRLFGKKEACMIPTPEVRARFLSRITL